MRTQPSLNASAGQTAAEGRRPAAAPPPPGAGGARSSDIFSYQGAGGTYRGVPYEDDSMSSHNEIPPEFSGISLNPPILEISMSSSAGRREQDERLLDCLQYSRAIRVLAVLNAIVNLYCASAFTPMILMLWGPIAGYISSTFQLKATYAFLFYYILRISWDIGWLISGGKSWVVVWIFLITDIASLGLVYMYLKVLRTCSPADVKRLRDPRTSWAPAFFPMNSTLAGAHEASMSGDSVDGDDEL